MNAADRQVQRIIAAVRRKDKVGTFRALLEPLLVEGANDDAFEFLALTLATRGSNLHRERIGFLEFLKDLGSESPAMVSESTVKRAIKPFGRKAAFYVEDEDEEEN